MESYKIHVRLGDSEFNAEGPENTVKEAYERFLATLQAHPTPKRSIEAPENDGRAPATTSGVATAILQRVFQVDRDADQISLRLLPPDGTTRSADALLLLLYGFRALLGHQDVPVTKLLAAARQSGVTMERVDRVIGSHAQFVIKGGTRVGGRYTLNNLGVTRAEALLRELFR